MNNLLKVIQAGHVNNKTTDAKYEINTCYKSNMSQSKILNVLLTLANVYEYQCLIS